MNRQALLAQAPTDAQWQAMAPAAKQEAVVNLAVAALDECIAHGQELDAWEAVNLRSALGAIYMDFFSAAWNDVVLAMAPPNERAPGWEQRFAGEIPAAHRFRAAFDQARYKPAPAALLVLFPSSELFELAIAWRLPKTRTAAIACSCFCRGLVLPFSQL